MCQTCQQRKARQECVQGRPLTAEGCCGDQGGSGIRLPGKHTAHNSISEQLGQLVLRSSASLQGRMYLQRKRASSPVWQGFVVIEFATAKPLLGCNVATDS